MGSSSLIMPCGIHGSTLHRPASVDEFTVNGLITATRGIRVRDVCRYKVRRATRRCRYSRGNSSVGRNTSVSGAGDGGIGRCRERRTGRPWYYAATHIESHLNDLRRLASCSIVIRPEIWKVRWRETRVRRAITRVAPHSTSGMQGAPRNRSRWKRRAHRKMIARYEAR